MTDNRSTPDLAIVNVESETHSELNTADVQHELNRLRHENTKLKKINNVLMRRVEMGWGNHSDAYQSFEDAALLAEKVKERTNKLQQTLYRLEESNQQLEKATSEAQKNRYRSELERQRLNDAIESISDSLVLFDAQRRMLMVNSRCSEFWEKHGLKYEIGQTTFQQITAQSLPLIDTSSKAQKTISTHTDPITQTIFKLKDGTWIQMSERNTAEGGLVVVYTDITSIKQSDARRYEAAMAEQAKLLKATLENMTEGVVLLNEFGEVETWNQRLEQIIGLSNKHIFRGADFDDIVTRSIFANLLTCDAFKTENDQPQEREVRVGAGQVVLIKHQKTPTGGTLITFSDITERSRQRYALEESEKRIRLITDAMPAMISYVNKALRYEFVNKEFERYFQMERESILNTHLSDLLGDRVFSDSILHIERALLGQTVNFEVEVTRDNIEPRVFDKTFIPHFDYQHKVIGFFALEQDVTEQRRTAKALKHAYDYMEQRVYQRTEKISEINTQLRNEIAIRKQAEQRLREAKQEADHANESKTRFLAATSHDLLQPMNSARLFASALAEQTLPEEARKLLEPLCYSLENVESLITALVDISKLEAGLIEPVIDEFPLDELLNQMATEFTVLAHKKGLTFRHRTTSLRARTDGYLLARILRNLLTNAVRYTQSGQILLGTRRRKTGIEIQIIDTGVGIPQDKLGDIFREFHRINAPKKRHDQGLGLGLAIVEKLAHVLNHSIRVHSIENRGSVFSVLVPFAQQRTIEQPQQDANTDNQHSVIAGKNILLVDNDPVICQGMENLLHAWGCQVFSVQTLSELNNEAWLAGLDINLIITDYHLDDGDTGFDALDIIERTLGDDIPVIMITANYTNELRHQVRSKGHALLNKPVKPHKLKLMLGQYFSDTDGQD